MSHRKVHSQGSIPFSWESSPGISRFDPEGCTVGMIPDSWKPKIPPPPGTAQSARRRGSVRARFRRVQDDDPFLAAYKECMRRDGDAEAPTKVSSHCGGEAGGGKKGSPRKKKGSAMFSCKSSCDVREDNFMAKKSSSNTAVPPPLPGPPSERTTPRIVPVRKCQLILQ
ncbi:hypothetical protein MLD38_028540 [Melastoma candidum]|uniref:Uncharacterized protein n=1 Tax=Melastoma candidum TaxID=119954 RepID=A0ACB9N5P5_9MYRT|nr:hypothetical protein MLD38_028540 [Melastoma candidum]